MIALQAPLPWSPLAVPMACASASNPASVTPPARARQARIAALLGTGGAWTVSELAVLVRVPWRIVDVDVCALTSLLPIVEDDDGRISLDMDALRGLGWE